jgi:O-antigen ligase
MSKKHLIQVSWQLVWSKWLLLGALFLVPLYASIAHWYPFTTPKTLLVIWTTSVAAILFIWGMLRDRSESFRITYIHYIVWAFLAALAIASVFGINPHQSFFGTFYSSTSVVLLVMCAVAAMLIAEFVRRDGMMIRYVARAVFASGVVTALATYLSHEGSQWQLFAISGGGGFVGNTSFTGGFMVFVVGWGIYLLAIARTWSTRIWSILGLLVIGLSPLFINWQGSGSLLSMLGQAQGAVLGLVIAAIAGVALICIISKKKLTKVIGVVLGLAIVVGIVLAYRGLFVPESALSQKFVELKSGTRLIFWDIAKEAMNERPLLGWGFENYQTVYQDHFDPRVYDTGNTYEQWVSNPHNVLFDIGVSTGWLGLLLYGALFGVVGWVCFSVARTSSERSHRALVVIPAILIAYFIQNLFIFDTPTTWYMYFVLIAIAMGVATTGKEVVLDTDTKKGLAIFKIIGFVAVIIVFVFLPAHESRQWVRARDMAISTERIALQERVQQISLMGSVDDTVVYTQKAFVTLAEARATLSPQDKNLFFDMADSLIGMLDRESVRYPADFYTRYLAGSLTHLAYSVDTSRGVVALDAAKQYFDEARIIAPRNPKVYYNLAQNALLRKDTTTARMLVEQGMALGALGEGEALLTRIKK